MLADKLNAAAREADDHDRRDRCPRLDRWRTAFGGGLTGTVYDHPRFKDGETIVTSRVVEAGSGWAKTLNTFYVLGIRQ